MTEKTGLKLGEPGDEKAWRRLVEAGLKGAPWEKLVREIASGIAIEPLYREADFPTAQDVSGFPGAAPFIRGVRTGGAWDIRQSYAHPDPERTNSDILADLAGGVSGIELVIDAEGINGLAIADASTLDRALAGVVLEAAPVSLDTSFDRGALSGAFSGAFFGAGAAALLIDKLKGVAPQGTAFNLAPICAGLRYGAPPKLEAALDFTLKHRSDLPAARFLRVDARVVHEAGGTETLEIAYALKTAITYLRGLTDRGLDVAQAAKALGFAVSVGADVLVEAAKLRALRLCWARVLEASGAASADRGAYIHAFTARNMMTRADAWTNILRITTAAFAAAIGSADAIATACFTDALGLPGPFARRLARNTQHVLLEEARLGQVEDPAGGAWFVEKLTRELAERAWGLMQQMEAHGEPHFLMRRWVAEARLRQEQLIATRRQTITGVTDFPLLGAPQPEFEAAPALSSRTQSEEARKQEGANGLAPVRWAEPFETLRARGEAAKASVFFANMATLAEFSPRANFARNLLAAGGIAAIGPEAAYETMEALFEAFKASGAQAAIICSSDACYAQHGPACASGLKRAGASWVMLAGKDEASLRSAGVDQFLFAGDNALSALAALHSHLGFA
jgi:methylmalonyl-CoA mutase